MSYLANEITNAERLTARGSAFGLVFLASHVTALPPAWYDALRAVLTAQTAGQLVEPTQAALLTATTTSPILWSCAGNQDVHADTARAWFIGVRISAEMHRLSNL